MRQSSARWWKADKDDAHKSVFAVIDYLDATQSWIQQADDFHASMYAGVRAGTPEELSPADYMFAYEPQQLARNVARSAVDTYVAKIFRHRPLPEVLASHGNWRDQRRARKMTQLIEGQFDKDKIFKKWARVIGRDAGVTGRGILKIDLETLESKSLRCERVLPKELRVDAADAKYGDPRNIYLVRDVDAGVLIEMVAPGGESEDASDEEKSLVVSIRAAAAKWTADSNSRTLDAPTVDRVQVVESWHLCDNVEAHEDDEEHECTGRHCMCIRGADLVDEDWPFQRFPFAILNYLEPYEGYFGVGLCEQLEGYQVEQAQMDKKVSDSHYYSGGGIIYVPNTGPLVEEDFTNSVWKVLRGPPGAAPTFINPEPLHPATYQYRNDIRPDALAEVGLNEMSAQGEKPAGLNSGIAINSYDDIQDVRIGMQGYQYAQWCVDVAELEIMWIQHIAKTHGDYTVKCPIKDGIVELSWKDVSIDNFVVQVHPSALMQQTPAARRQYAEQLFNAHQIDGFTFMRLVDSPDPMGEMDTQMADRLLVDDEIESMLDAEKPSDPDAYKPPSPYCTNLEWSLQRCVQRLAEAVRKGAPEENCELLRDRILDTLALKQKQAGAGAAPDMAAPGMPPPPPPDGAPPPGAPPAPVLPQASPLPVPPPVPMQ